MPTRHTKEGMEVSYQIKGLAVISSYIVGKSAYSGINNLSACLFDALVGPPHPPPIYLLLSGKKIGILIQRLL